MCERGATRGGGLDQARKECLDRERWRLFCLGEMFLKGARCQRFRLIDKNIALRKEKVNTLKLHFEENIQLPSNMEDREARYDLLISFYYYFYI